MGMRAAARTLLGWAAQRQRAAGVAGVAGGTATRRPATEAVDRRGLGYCESRAEQMRSGTSRGGIATSGARSSGEVRWLGCRRGGADVGRCWAVADDWWSERKHQVVAGGVRQHSGAVALSLPSLSLWSRLAWRREQRRRVLRLLASAKAASSAGSPTAGARMASSSEGGGEDGVGLRRRGFGLQEAAFEGQRRRRRRAAPPLPSSPSFPSFSSMVFS